MWMDLLIPDGYDEIGRPFFIEKTPYIFEIVPIYDCEHDDKESGQDYPHYHRDFRYTLPKELKNKYKLSSDARPQLKDYEGFIMIDLKLFETEHLFSTHNSLISSYSGKKLNCKTCPHRGFSLEHIVAKNGVITCPLHGTRIDETTLIVL